MEWCGSCFIKRSNWSRIENQTQTFEWVVWIGWIPSIVCYRIVKFCKVFRPWCENNIETEILHHKDLYCLCISYWMLPNGKDVSPSVVCVGLRHCFGRWRPGRSCYSWIKRSLSSYYNVHLLIHLCIAHQTDLLWCKQKYKWMKHFFPHLFLRERYIFLTTCKHLLPIPINH